MCFLHELAHNYLGLNRSGDLTSGVSDSASLGRGPGMCISSEFSDLGQETHFENHWTRILSSFHDPEAGVS